jgi:hypothetical protein
MAAGTPVQLRLPDDELNALDARRRKQSNPPTRSQELRKLLRPILLKPSQNESEDQRA